MMPSIDGKVRLSLGHITSHWHNNEKKRIRFTIHVVSACKVQCLLLPVTTNMVVSMSYLELSFLSVQGSSHAVLENLPLGIDYLSIDLSNRGSIAVEGPKNKKDPLHFICGPNKFLS